jgi:Uma2 family endonuclease
VEEYRRMGESGILTEDDRVELLEGWVVPKVIHNPRHDATIDQVQETLRPLLPPRWRLRIQSAIATGESEPEPDLAIVLGLPASFIARHPGPQDMALVIEAADSSLATERDIKGRIYARAGIPVYWIVNLVDAVVEVYSDPTGPGQAPAFRTREVFGLGDSIPLVIAGHDCGAIAVRDLIP